jgi:heat shock protein HtpX
LSEQIAANKRKTFILMLGFALPLLIVGAVLVLLAGAGPIGFVVVAVLVIGASVALYAYSDKAALAISHANPADEQQQARLYNLVEGLCIASGLPMPKLYIIDDDAPNAFSTGLNPKRAAIVVTTGLLEKLNRLELEGVLAHELSHIRNYDILPMTLTVMMARMLVFAPVIASVTKFAVSPQREYDADASGAQLTRYPPGLISALEKLQGDTTSIHSASKATAHLWIEQPLANDAGPGRPSHQLFDTHPPLGDRIRALQAM